MGFLRFLWVLLKGFLFKKQSVGFSSFFGFKVLWCFCSMFSFQGLYDFGPR